jgi:hypothetical protein
MVDDSKPKGEGICVQVADSPDVSLKPIDESYSDNKSVIEPMLDSHADDYKIRKSGRLRKQPQRFSDYVMDY